MKLLIADDEQYVRDSLAEEIEWSRYGIELAGVASDGREAVEMGQRLRPDVLLTDIRMPHGSGLDVMRKLKETLPKLRAFIDHMRQTLAEYIRRG